MNIRDMNPGLGSSELGRI